ncbi:MAG: hypothetical protein ACOC0C_01100 [Bacteroidota bacterium]
MKKFVSVILVLFSLTGIKAQQLSENHVLSLTFSKSGKEASMMYVIDVYATADNIKEDLSRLEPVDYRSHILGEAVAKRLHLFEKYYAFKSDAAPGSFSGRKLVEKPAIYNSIYKLEKHYKKAARKNREEISYFSEELVVFLDYALLMSHASTEEFEQALRNAKSVMDIRELFKKVVFK